MERLQKAIAQAGICSRRKPERGAPISTLSQTEKLDYAFSYSLSYLNN